MIYKIIILYFILMSLAGLISMGKDKRKAVTRRARTPESRLLTYAVLGGSVGSILGMLAFRHKTKHLKFTLGLPAILIAQLIIVAVVIFYSR